MIRSLPEKITFSVAFKRSFLAVNKKCQSFITREKKR